ncbi:tRNA dimethylallyltransferase 2-like isoform X2 [Papaver somniferum]|uniref:tRNA dimethylallyltransferase 2-like isoform X2 n=1 Tax=Papaver somniferum TaxID=3469 RepID=UPI000E705FAC|nr:tRNA dimethylallyltransferase 2-like isoform X2 [Papaver somniferum]
METEEAADVINTRNHKTPKVVIIMRATGAGKSRLAIDFASHFPVEIINADSMQVYNGLDILTNKVTLQEQKGIPHHLLGNNIPNVELTSKYFRDAAIQALVNPFFLDDYVLNMDNVGGSSLPADRQSDCKYE